MDAVAALLELTRLDGRIELTPIVYCSGCRRLLFRAETDEAAQSTLTKGGFNFGEHSSGAPTGLVAMVFVASVEGALQCAEKVNQGKHFFICDLPDEHVEVQLDVLDVDQHVQSTCVDTLYQVRRNASQANCFAKAGSVGTLWQPRLLLLASILKS
ncbi:TPA: hypothetical protein ACH3X1_014302 [Trebouxia sp. C0004]